MKKNLIIAAVVLLTTGALFAGSARAQVKPDLTVSKVEMTKSAQGLIEKITVTVTNGCRASAGATYVMVTFKTSEASGSKPLYYVGNSMKALKGGESGTLTLDITAKKIAFGRHMLVEVDPYKKVAEASEDNNWRTLFPDAAGAPLNSTQCSPKI